METVPEINLIVLGASQVGKSSFIQCSMELPTPTTASVVARKMLVDGNPYLVRLVEMSIKDVKTEADDVIVWPEKLGDSRVPRVDGVLSLYDVGDKASFEDVPELLSKSSLALRIDPAGYLCLHWDLWQMR
jgi:GTPase SAR1 family protein